MVNAEQFTEHAYSSNYFYTSSNPMNLLLVGLVSRTTAVVSLPAEYAMIGFHISRHPPCSLGYYLCSNTLHQGGVICCRDLLSQPLDPWRSYTLYGVPQGALVVSTRLHTSFPEWSCAIIVPDLIAMLVPMSFGQLLVQNGWLSLRLLSHE